MEMCRVNRGFMVDGNLAFNFCLAEFVVSVYENR
jgi:hypothetical protein